MRNIGEEDQLIFSQLLLYVNTVTQTIEVTNNTEGKIQGYHQ